MLGHRLHKLNASVRAGCLSSSKICISEGNDCWFKVPKRIQKLVCKGAEGWHPLGGRWQSVEGAQDVTLDIASSNNY